jgi:phenylalanyl-tRNA synthetase beta chain
MDTLRTSLVPGLLEAVARNLNLGNPTLRLFEIGHVFRIDSSAGPRLVEDFVEEERVSVVMTGLAGPLSWSGSGRACDIFDIKGEIQDVLTKFALDKSRFISYSSTNGLTDNTLGIEIQGVYAGYLGQVSKEVMEQFGVEDQVFVAELSVASLKSDAARAYVPLPRYPKVRRDVAFIVDAGVPGERIERTIRTSSTGLLQSVELFDVYEGDPLPAGKKSVAFTLGLMSTEKTLTDSEIDAAVRVVVAAVEREEGATLRSMR